MNGTNMPSNAASISSKVCSSSSLCGSTSGFFTSCFGQDSQFRKPSNKCSRAAASSALGQATRSLNKNWYTWNPVAASSLWSSRAMHRFSSLGGVFVDLVKCFERFACALHFPDRGMPHLSVQVCTLRVVTEPVRFCEASQTI